MISAKKIMVSSGGAVIALLPFVALAAAGTEQTCQTVTNITGLFNCLAGIIGYLIDLAFVIAWLFFLYGMVKFIRNADDSGKREEGREFMLWSVFALFIMVVVWGLVGVLSNTFGFSSRGSTQQSGSYQVFQGGLINNNGEAVGGP